jgi:hypothetical protein
MGPQHAFSSTFKTQLKRKLKKFLNKIVSPDNNRFPDVALWLYMYITEKTEKKICNKSLRKG